MNYAFVYPNLMINRYGTWMDTNVVYPVDQQNCIVHFDWWIDKQLAHDSTLIDAGVRSSDQVSVLATCQAVPYDAG